MADMTTGDLALLKDNGIFGNGGGGILLFFVIMLLMMGGGWGGNRGPAPATQADMTAGLNNQAVQAQLQQIALSSANNNYETARLIQAQSAEMAQQNNTNLINAIQGFNNLGLALTNQTNVLSQQIQDLGSKMEACCCSIKTQMLQDRLADRDRQLAVAQGDISNYNQTQYILGQMGRWVGWTPSGSQAAPTVGT